MFGLGLSRYLPDSIRPHVVRAADKARREIDNVVYAADLRAKRKSEPKPYRGRRVAILGFIATPSGLGRGARLMHAEMARRGVTVDAFDVEPLLERDRPRARAEIARLVAFAPEDLVVHVNPPSMRDVIRRLPRDLMTQTSVVAYWAWELNVLPPSWARDAKLADAIWTPSPFVAEAVKASLADFAGDMRVEPHPVESDPMPRGGAQRRAAARAKAGIREDAFVAGFSFTMASNYARKNPTAVIDAFQRAFPPATENAVLILRCPDLDNFPQGAAELRARAEADPRILLRDREAIGIVDFYHALDVFVSLARSEGYGLQLVEALDAGAAVVTTAWSISPEILARDGVRQVGSRLVPVIDRQDVYGRVPGGQWAAPDIDEAAQHLRQLAQR
ncbi:MAG: glycosyltransferase [Hyphomonadaceae bacterium]